MFEFDSEQIAGSRADRRRWVARHLVDVPANGECVGLEIIAVDVAYAWDCLLEVIEVFGDGRDRLSFRIAFRANRQTSTRACIRQSRSCTGVVRNGPGADEGRRSCAPARSPVSER